MSADRPLVAAVTINYHTPEMTERAVASLLASQDVRMRVVVVDNEARDDWAPRLAAGDERIETISNVENVGFGAACNQGIELALAAGADAVLIFNNDARIAPDAASRLFNAAREAGLATPKIVFPDGRIYAAGGLVEPLWARCRNRGFGTADGPAFSDPKSFRFGSGCALMIARVALIGGERFHEPYFLYYEDADLCLRLAAAGHRVAYVPEARVTHEGSATMAKAEGAQVNYYKTRNRFIFLRRNAAPFTRAMGIAYLLVVCGVKMPRLWLGGHREAARLMARACRDGLAGREGPLPARS